MSTQPAWVDGVKRTITKTEEHEILDIAVGKLAKAVVAGVKTFFTGIPGLAGFFTDLGSTTEQMSWDAGSELQDQAMIKFDKETKTLVVLTMKQKTHDNSTAGFIFAHNKHSLAIEVQFRRMVADNDAAVAVCQRLVNEQVDTLAEATGAMELFGGPV